MTLKETYSFCVSELYFSDCAEFEAQCLIEDFLGYYKHQIHSKDIVVDESNLTRIYEAISRRQNGEPLQYILGKWDFYDLTFSVGEGVLIPRPETEMLVDFALDKIKNIKNPILYDLCSGTGCIGLTIAKHRPDATVYLLEKESNAFKYLSLNKNELKLENAFIIQDDLYFVDLSVFPHADIILSNPPYINSDEISGLQKEVQFEPISALDGGNDGLDFYRCIAQRWQNKVKKNGYIALECGEEQSNSIIDIFHGKYTECNVIFDFNNIDRIVTFGI